MRYVAAVAAVTTFRGCAHVRPTFWRVSGVSGMRATATSNVIEISIKSHIRAAVDGLIIGFLVGAPWGAESIDNPNGPTSRFANRMEAGLAGGVQGGVLGLPIGAIVGSRIRFRLRPPH